MITVKCIPIEIILCVSKMKKVLLMGKSGSGKTSMLNIIFGNLTKKDTELLDTKSESIKTSINIDITIEEDINSYDDASKLSGIILDTNIAKSPMLLEQNEVSDTIVDNNAIEESILINNSSGNLSNIIVNNSPDKDLDILNLTSSTSDIILDNKAKEDTSITQVNEQTLKNSDDNISNVTVNNSPDKDLDVLNLTSSTSDIILDNEAKEDTAVMYVHNQALKNSDDNISNVTVNNSPEKDLDILNLTSSTSDIILDNKAKEDTAIMQVNEQTLKNSDDNISNVTINSLDKDLDVLNLTSSTSDIILDNEAKEDAAITHVYKQILRNLIIDIWDCKDYEVLEEMVQQDILFSNVEILIYVFDIKCDEEDLTKIYKDYQICGNLVHTYSSSALIFGLIHKSDLILSNQKDMLFLECENNMTKILKLEKCFITSIFDQSLYEAWSSIVKYLIPSIEDVDKSLTMLANTIECDAIFLFDCPTFLNIYSNMFLINETTLRYNEISTIIRRFQLKCKHLGSKFINWQVSNTNFSVLLESFTPDSYVIVVTNEPQLYDLDQISSLIKSAGADFWELRNADQNDQCSIFSVFEV